MMIMLRTLIFACLPLFAFGQASNNDYIFTQKTASGFAPINITPTANSVLTFSGTALVAGGVTGAMIADGAINVSKLAQSSATSGQVLAWNGSAWAPAASSSGVTIGSTAITGGTTGRLLTSGTTVGELTLGSGVSTWMGTPSSANLASAVTDETGSGSLVFGTSPTISGGSVAGLTQFGVSMANNTAITGFALGTITDTTSRPLSITQTWNNASLTATAFQVNVTNTSSATASLLADFQTGGTSQFNVRRDGRLWSGFVGLSGSYAGSNGQLLLYQGAGDIVLEAIGSNGIYIINTLPIRFGTNWNNSAGSAYIYGPAADVIQQGLTSATPAAQTLRAAIGSGTNITGASYTIQAGNGTGTGGSGVVNLQTAPAGASGTTANTMRTVLQARVDGHIDMPAATVEAAASAASTHKITIYINGTRYKVLAIQE